MNLFRQPTITSLLGGSVVGFNVRAFIQGKYEMTLKRTIGAINNICLQNYPCLTVTVPLFISIVYKILEKINTKCSTNPFGMFVSFPISVPFTTFQRSVGVAGKIDTGEKGSLGCQAQLFFTNPEE